MTVAPTSLPHRETPHRYQLALVALLVGVGVGIGAAVLVHDVFQGSSDATGTQGSGIAATQTRHVAAFSGIELAGSNNVVVRVGGKQSVVVRADDNLLRRVTTDVNGGTLVIGNTAGTFTTKSPMSVEVTVPSLKTLTLSGSGVVSVRDLESRALTLTLSGSGVVRASGAVNQLDVALGGAGDAQLQELAAQHVTAVVTGSGRIVVHATKTLDASVPGSGAIVYSGDPRVTTSITGSGAVVRG